MYVILDKSYLEGASKADVQCLCDNNNVLMPQSLFYELLTTKLQQRVNCFRKLPERDNPVGLVPNIGTLFKFEVENRRPCHPISEILINVQFQFNKGLSNLDFTFTDRDTKTINEWNKVVVQDIESFKRCSAVVTGWFPELNGLPPGSSEKSIENAINTVCESTDSIRQIYKSIKRDFFPPSELINKEWTLFRWVQVRILASLEYIRKYGARNEKAISKKIENDVLDIEYCIIACVVGNMAYRDKQLSAMFMRLCPEGKLIN